MCAKCSGIYTLLRLLCTKVQLNLRMRYASEPSGLLRCFTDLV